MVRKTLGLRRVRSLLGCAISILAACNEKKNFKDPQAVPRAADLIQSRSPNIPKEPTNPEGGSINGRAQQLTEEESEKRVFANRVPNIILGKGVANITMDTTLFQANKILSEPLFAQSKQVKYEEGIIVTWNDTAPRIPQLISVTAAYQGKLLLPAPLPAVKVGQSLADFIGDTPAETDDLLIRLAQYFDEKDESYNCIQVNACVSNSDREITRYLFKKGGFIISNNRHKILLGVFLWPETSPTREPISVGGTFGESLAGISVTTVKAEAEAILGPSLGILPNGRTMYDNGNLTVFWNFFEPFNAVRISALEHFQGKILFPEPLGDLNLGQSLKAHFPPENGDTMVNATALANKLAKALDGLPVENLPSCIRYRSCSVDVDQDQIAIVLDKGGLFIGNDEEKALLGVEYLIPPPPRTVPLNLPVRFGDSVGDLNLSTLQVAATAIVGAPRGDPVDGVHFIDNDNLVVIWRIDEPLTPEVIQLNSGYEGLVNFPESFGPIKMGDSFASFFTPEDPDGAGLIRSLAAFYREELDPTNYDCLAEKTCEINKDNPDFISFRFENGSMYFNHLDDKKALFILDIREDNLAKDPR